ncbi:MAG: hypothetical protein ACFFBR_11365 [Promethearchaeota archaeon]
MQRKRHAGASDAAPAHRATWAVLAPFPLPMPQRARTAMPPIIGGFWDHMPCLQ